MRTSGAREEAGRLQAEEERELGTAVGCMAGMMDRQLVEEVEAVCNARTPPCLASCIARMGRARRTAGVAGGCEWSRYEKCCGSGRGQLRSALAVADTRVVQVAVAMVELWQGRVADTVGTGCMRLGVADTVLPWLASRSGSLDSVSNSGDVMTSALSNASTSTSGRQDGG